MSFWRNFGQLVDEFANDIYQDGLKQPEDVQKSMLAASDEGMQMGMHELEDKFINEGNKYIKAGYALALQQRQGEGR